MISLTIYPLTFFLYLKVNQRGEGKNKESDKGKVNFCGGEGEVREGR